MGGEDAEGTAGKVRRYGLRAFAAWAIIEPRCVKNRGKK
jgi:hypothetical protein